MKLLQGSRPRFVFPLRVTYGGKEFTADEIESALEIVKALGGPERGQELLALQRQLETKYRERH